MYRVGITGGIGSGKSFVCSILEKFGIPVYYADSQARRLMNTDSRLRSAIKEAFGEEIYRNGELDRQEMALRVFGEPGLLESINQLVHPVVREDFERWTEGQEGVPYVVEEAAILFESGAVRNMNMSVLIYAPIPLRIQRVMDRDKVSRLDVEKRISRQMDEEEKKKLADRVIYNDEKNLLLPQIVGLHEDILIRI
ncbi:MAG: dephospho-CoA kinase [Bacteroides sp.]|nr:dephospho-CoA kinase [Bacteroides sp.]